MSAHAPTAVRPIRTVRIPTAPVRAPRASVARRTAGPVAARLAATVHARLAEALQAWNRWRRVRSGLAELRALDDRMLADLGIDRGSVERAARSGRR